MSPDQMHIASNLMSLCFCESMSNFLYLLKNRLLAILHLKLGANEDKSRKSKPFLSFFYCKLPHAQVDFYALLLSDFNALEIICIIRVTTIFDMQVMSIEYLL